MNFAILGPQACSGCEVDDTYQIWCTYDEPFRSYSISSRFSFFVGGHLEFWKIVVLALLLSGQCQGETPCQIWWESDERRGSNSSFCKLLNFGRRPSWIMNFEILGPQACFGWEVDGTHQIWYIQDEPFWSNSIFSKCRFFVSGHLGFWKMALLTLLVSGRCQGEALCQIWWGSDERFGSYSSFCKFQNGGRRPSWIMNFTILRSQVRSGCRVDDTCQIWYI